MPARRLGRFAAFCASVLTALSLLSGSADAQMTTDERMKMLEEQLRIMQEQLQSLQRELQETRAEAERATTTAEEAQEQADEVKQAQGEIQEGLIYDKPIVTSGQPKVKLAVSGHINRAMNTVGDGDQTKTYFVDNDVSTSRIRFVGTGDLGDGTSVGTQIELSVSPNNSSNVSQTNEDSGDFFDQRKVEAFARNDSYGEARFGKGATASEDTSEYDLSLVGGPIMYSGVADIVGAVQFTDGRELTGIRVDNAFFNFDGLGRRDRILYESPIIGPGLQISTSATANQRYDISAKWGYDYNDWTGVEIGDFLTLGAVSLSEPNSSGVDYRVNGSFSTIHTPTGLGLTVSGGTDRGSRDPYNMYGKLSWDTEFFDFGQTGFGVDYTYGKDQCNVCDEGQSVGLGAVQLIEDWGIELYSQFRWFTLDRSSSAGPENLDDIYVGTIGTRTKF